MQSQAPQQDEQVGRNSLGVVWVPDWPIIAAIAEGDLPGHLPSAVTHGSHIQAVSAQARRLGVGVGMSIRSAQSLVPELEVTEENPFQRIRAFEPVMNAIDEVVADAVVLRPGLVMFKAKGPVQFYGDEFALGEKLLGATAQAGVEASMGIAEGFLPAILAARQSRFIHPSRTEDFLFPHPVETLLHAVTTSQKRQEYREVIGMWKKLGLTCLGDVANLDRGMVAARFGYTGAEAHKLSQGLGWVEPAEPSESPHLRVGIDIDPPAQRLDTIAFVAKELAHQLHNVVTAKGLGSQLLRVIAETEVGEEHNRSWRLEGMVDAKEVVNKVRWQLSGWLDGRSEEKPNGGIIRIDLVAENLYPAGEHQTKLWGVETSGGKQAHQAVQKVQSFLGPQGVIAAVEQGGRTPMERIRYVTWGDEPQNEQREHSPWVGQFPKPLPTTVFMPARKVEITGEDLLVRMTQKGGLTTIPQYLHYEGKRYVIDAWAGPWPIYGRWWQGEVPRAYLQVVTGTAAWLIAGGEHGWVIEGGYD